MQRERPSTGRRFTRTWQTDDYGKDEMSLRRSGTRRLSTGKLRAGIQDDLNEAQADADADGDIRDVANEEVAVGEEIGHVTDAESRRGKESIDEVAHCSAPDESDSDRPRDRLGSPRT